MNKALQILQIAKQKRVAIGAFNVGNLETIKAITQAAKSLRSPILIEASPGEAQHIGVKQLVALARTYEDQMQLPIILNLDHGTDTEIIKQAILEGFDYVHYDGGKLPYDEYVSSASKIVELAHKHNILVEGEIDHIEGSSADHTSESTEKYADPKLFTNPARAKDFVEKTGIDVFASFIGNLHGIYANQKHLNLEILQSIHSEIPNTFLSLHGGSGIFDDDVKKAISLGIVKVNVNSEMRIAFKMTLQKELNKTTEIAAYKYTASSISAVQKVVENKIKLFGSQEILM